MDFGKPDSQFIQNMFDRLARRYDLFNHLTSLGLAGRWRNAAVLDLEPGMRVLDLGCGTGDLFLGAVKKTGSQGEVVGLDFSQNMLSFARRRYQRLGLNSGAKHRFVLEKAQALPIEKEPYDAVLSGFVLRNLYENIDTVLWGVYRSLKSGGMIRFLDITEPSNKVIKFLWTLYMNTLVALYGKLLFGKDYPLFYLTKSAKRFLKAPELIQKLKNLGFLDVQAQFFMFGIIALYKARKP
jgi:demethylmenaquinone methyltransferase/2-methoxy-6-polyprenyl-1,4-benzoquinol methylase